MYVFLQGSLSTHFFVFTFNYYSCFSIFCESINLLFASGAIRAPVIYLKISTV